MPGYDGGLWCRGGSGAGRAFRTLPLLMPARVMSGFNGWCAHAAEAGKGGRGGRGGWKVPFVPLLYPESLCCSVEYTRYKSIRGVHWTREKLAHQIPSCFLFFFMSWKPLHAPD